MRDIVSYNIVYSGIPGLGFTMVEGYGIISTHAGIDVRSRSIMKLLSGAIFYIAKPYERDAKKTLFKGR